jgi:hypothetical protein
MPILFACHLSCGAMERGGSDSWRVIFDPRPALLEQVLFVRDATGVAIEPDPEIPPRLRDEVPDHSSYFSPHWRASAGVSWRSWWQAVVRYEAARQLAFIEPDPPLASAHQFGSGSWGAVPPRFPEMGQDASSAVAIDRVLELAMRWSRSRNPLPFGTRPASRIALHEQERFSVIASETAVRLGVALGKMRAVVLTLSVSGDWSSGPLDGVLLCSESVLEDERQFAPLLADTFEAGMSGLTLQRTVTHRVPSTQSSILISPLLIADGGDVTLRLDGVYLAPGGFELEISRNGDSAHLQPRPYPTGQGQTRDPESLLDHFAGLEVHVHVDAGSLGAERSPQGPTLGAAVNRFWRPGRGPTTLWLWVSADSPEAHVTIITRWPGSEIDLRPVEFDLRRSDTD